MPKTAFKTINASNSGTPKAEKPQDATIQDLVDAIYHLSTKIDELSPLATLAEHLNDYLDDPQHVTTSGIPICLQDIAPFTRAELSKAVYDALHDDHGEIVISVKNPEYGNDGVFSVGVYEEDN